MSKEADEFLELCRKVSTNIEEAMARTGPSLEDRLTAIERRLDVIEQWMASSSERVAELEMSDMIRRISLTGRGRTLQ